MPVYTFELRDGDRRIEDGSGVTLPDREHARHYALDVARELMSCREAQTRTWRLDVYDGSGERIFELPFASIDPTLDHLIPEMRTTVERMCDRSRSLREAIAAAKVTLRESRALVALSRGRPYLATEMGERTIRSC
jgi:hypothetical protein